MLGKTISHYKVLEKIGQGGMGTVYRAQDTTLDREVAIKVLPEQFACDAHREWQLHHPARQISQKGSLQNHSKAIRKVLMTSTIRALR